MNARAVETSSFGCAQRRKKNSAGGGSNEVSESPSHIRNLLLAAVAAVVAVAMGFSDTQIVDGQEQHAAEFTCTVCLNLVDAPLLTTCAHVFCTACLQDWFDTKPSCPTCSVELDPRHGAGRLQIASPLAWRVLGRLRMRCTVTGCGWVGEYSELTAHMTSDSAHQATAASPKPRTSASSGGDATPTGGGGGGGGGITSDAATAEALKDAGNAKFSQRIYPEAAALYSKAIGLAPLVPTYRLNRAAARYMLGDYRGAITDCEAALKLEPNNAKAFKRLSKAHIELGDFTRATEVLAAAAAAGAAASTFSEEASLAAQLGAWQAEGEAAYGNGDFAMACTFFANILQKTNAVPTRLWMTRAELALGRCDRALRVTREVIKADANQGAIHTAQLCHSHRAISFTGDQGRRQPAAAVRAARDGPHVFKGPRSGVEAPAGGAAAGPRSAGGSAGDEEGPEARASHGRRQAGDALSPVRPREGRVHRRPRRRLGAAARAALGGAPRRAWSRAAPPQGVR